MSAARGPAPPAFEPATSGVAVLGPIAIKSDRDAPQASLPNLGWGTVGTLTTRHAHAQETALISKTNGKQDGYPSRTRAGDSLADRAEVDLGAETAPSAVKGGIRLYC